MESLKGFSDAVRDGLSTLFDLIVGKSRLVPMTECHFQFVFDLLVFSFEFLDSSQIVVFSGLV